MSTKCKRVRFRVISRTRGEAFAVRMCGGRLMYMSIDPVTLKETHHRDQPCSKDYKNFSEFNNDRIVVSYWLELRRPS